MQRELVTSNASILRVLGTFTSSYNESAKMLNMFKIFIDSLLLEEIRYCED